MDILSKRARTLLNDENLRAKIDELLRVGDSSVIVDVDDHDQPRSESGKREPKQIVVRRLVA